MFVVLHACPFLYDFGKPVPYFFSHSDDHQILKWDFQSGEATQARLPGAHFRDCNTWDCCLSISRLSSFLRRRMPQTFTGFLPVSAQRRHQTSLTFLYWHALTVSLQLWGSCDLHESSCDLYDRSCDLLVSSPDPTCEERVWWHPADSLGFIKNS